MTKSKVVNKNHGTTNPDGIKPLNPSDKSSNNNNDDDDNNWFGDTVTVSHPANCYKNSKVRALS